MPKPPWTPWTASAASTICKPPQPRPCNAALPALLLCLTMLFSHIPQAHGATVIPSQHLSVAIDPAGHRLSGSAEILLPAGREYTLELAGITANSLSVDDTPQPISKEVLLPASPNPRRVTLQFSKECGAEEAGDCRIAEDGVSLTGAWHPRLDADTLYQLTASIPANFEAVSEAEEISSRQTKAGKEVRFLFPHALAGINLVAGPYLVAHQSFGNGQTLYSYFFKEDQELAGEYRKQALAYLHRYAKLLGPYPYRRFAIVENRLPTGYAMPGFTLLGQAVARLPFITATSLGHEVLHSWFGNGVLVSDQGGNWCEGLVTELADQTFASERGEGIAFRKRQLMEYQNYVGNDTSLRLRDFTGAAPPGGMDQEARGQRAVGYAKSAMLFHMLRQRIGETAFVAGLRNLYAAHRFGRASWDDLRRCFETAAGQNLSIFFDQWLERTDLPRLTAEKITVTEEEGQPVLSLSLQQEQAQPYNDLRVVVAVEAAGQTVRQQVDVTGQSTQVRIGLSDRPTRLILDPDYDLMRQLDPDELPPVWSRFVGSHQRLAVLPGPEEAEGLAPLVELVRSLDCPMKPADQVTSEDLAENDLLFLGSRSPLVRSLLAPPQPTDGFSLTVHNNPLAPERVAVVAASGSAEQSRLAVSKLSHYGQYSRLHFANGRLTDKGIAPSDQGLIWELEQPPLGIAQPQARPLEQISEQLRDRRVVYIGETHTRYEDHLLQLRLIRALFSQGKPLAIGMEMFSRSAQPALDRYVSGEINEAQFLKESRYFSRWGYDYRLYRDILSFARRQHLPVIGLNQDKEITATVFKKGIDGLSNEERALLPMDRDLGLPGYRRRIVEAFTMHGAHSANPAQANNFFQAQAIWDETMAASVADFLAGHPDHRMAVLAGNGHTDRQTGIPPRVARRLNGITQAVVANSDPEEFSATHADYLFFSAPASLPPAAVLGVLLGEEKDGHTGVVINDFSEQSKAREAGLRQGDVIVAVDEQPVATIEDLKIKLLGAKPDQTVTVRVRRPDPLFGDGEELSVPVPLSTPQEGHGGSPHTRP